jgi:hypothetical protein
MDDLAVSVEAAAAGTGFSGVVRVDVGDAVRFLRAHGMANRSSGVPVSVECQFGIASGTKGLTALTVVSLIEAGHLALTTTARSVLERDLPLVGDAVTVEHLLAHRSGIGDYLGEEADHDVTDHVMPVPVHELAPRSGRSCGPSPSVMSASSKPSSVGHCSGPGDWARARPARWSWIWTPRSARSTATRSRAPRTATRRCGATTRCWPPGPTPVRWSMPGSARATPTLLGGSCGSSTSSSPGSAVPAPVRRSSCERTRGSSSTSFSTGSHALGSGSASPSPQRAPVRAAIDAIPEQAWQRIDYPDGDAHVAECLYRGRRLIVRRVPGHHGTQDQLFATWRYHAFVTNLAGPAWALDRSHRAHAVVELSIRDLKAGPLAHLPSGSFNANSAWLQCAVLAHNLLRWTATLGQGVTTEQYPRPLQRHHRRARALWAALLRMPDQIVSVDPSVGETRGAATQRRLQGAHAIWPGVLASRLEGRRDPGRLRRRRVVSICPRPETTSHLHRALEHLTRCLADRTMPRPPAHGLTAPRVDAAPGDRDRGGDRRALRPARRCRPSAEDPAVPAP